VPEPSSTGWVPGIASDKGKNWPPLLEINPPKTSAIELQRPLPLPETSAPGSIPPPPPPPRFELPHSTAPARVPSCIQKLYNVALNDTSGKTWQYKTDHKGKLLLIDFWGTWCMPCRKTIPQLRDLQTRYGPQLEVIGIAYEGSGTPQEQAVRVNAVGQRLGVNYRQLLGGTNCPVQSQFAIAAYPTLVLLDETGTILWRHQGELEQSVREDLELLIQRQLGIR
jgi:thiol-disulfide isomerase/thioredoxin